MLVLIILLSCLLVLVCAVFFVFHIDKSIECNNSKFHEIEHYIHSPDALRRDSPKADLALNYMVVEFHNNRDENALLSIVKLYLFGLNPHYSPNKIIGLKIIQLINDNQSQFSKTFVLHCKVLWEQTSAQVYNDPDVFGHVELPDNIIQKLTQSIEYHRANNIALKPCSVQYLPPPENEQDQDIVENDILVDNTLEQLVRDTETNTNARGNVRSDSQNVHNISIPNSAMKALDRIVALNSTKAVGSFQDAVQSLKQDLITNELDDNTKTIAMQVVQTLSSSPHSKFKLSEQEVFIHVYSRVADSEDKASLVSLLTQNLASAVEYESVVCSTGKITRMISTFDVVDDEIPNLKPDWVLKEEISAIAAKTRNDVLDESGPEQRADYENDSNSSLCETMKNRFIDEITKRYVDVGILSEAGLTLLSAEYLDAF